MKECCTSSRNYLKTVLKYLSKYDFSCLCFRGWQMFVMLGRNRYHGWNTSVTGDHNGKSSKQLHSVTINGLIYNRRHQSIFKSLVYPESIYLYHVLLFFYFAVVTCAWKTSMAAMDLFCCSQHSKRSDCKLIRKQSAITTSLSCNLKLLFYVHIVCFSYKIGDICKF